MMTVERWIIYSDPLSKTFANCYSCRIAGVHPSMHWAFMLLILPILHAIHFGGISLQRLVTVPHPEDHLERRWIGCTLSRLLWLLVTAPSMNSFQNTIKQALLHEASSPSVFDCLSLPEPQSTHIRSWPSSAWLRPGLKLHKP